MALTHCIECNREISDRARSCPGCGAPITQASDIADTLTIQTNPVVIEKTSKTYKRHMLIAFIIAVCVAPFSIALGIQPSRTAGATTMDVFWILTLLMIGAAIDFLGAVIAAWWHHG